MGFEVGSFAWYLSVLILGMALGFLIAFIRKRRSKK